MRAVIQRVERAQVTVDDTVVGNIGQGLTVLLGVGSDDTGDDVAYLKKKLLQLRIFHGREALYRELIDSLRIEGVPVQSGRFRAMMKVSLVNDGPVTLILDSKKQF